MKRYFPFLEPISNCCGIIFLHERHEKHEKRENFVLFVSFVEENKNFPFCSFQSKKKYALAAKKHPFQGGALALPRLFCRVCVNLCRDEPLIFPCVLRCFSASLQLNLQGREPQRTLPHPSFISTKSHIPYGLFLVAEVVVHFRQIR